jgi:receptor protein-tyrosine kinase
MSKIFEALHKAQNPMAEALPPIAEAPIRAAAEAGPTPAADGAIPQAAVPDAEPPAAALRTAQLRPGKKAPVLPFEHWHAAEQYRLFRTRILQHPQKPRMIVVSSAGPGDGKSITAINLAGVLALKGDTQVVLIDGDFRRSSISSLLGLPEGPGLADVLEGTCDLSDALIQTEEYPNLCVIPAGTSKLNPVELLDSARWPAVCVQLRGLFQYLILDSPPVAAVADYDLLSAPSDGVVVVVRPDHSNREHCLKVLDGIPKDKYLGVVLNCVPNWFLGKADTYNGYYYAPGSGKS